MEYHGIFKAFKPKELKIFAATTKKVLLLRKFCVKFQRIAQISFEKKTKKTKKNQKKKQNRGDDKETKEERNFCSIVHRVANMVDIFECSDGTETTQDDA